MAFREFHSAPTSRRALLRGGAFLAAGSALSTLPLGRIALAHDISEAWPNVAAMIEEYVGSNKVANMLVTFGSGQEDHAHTVGGGKLAFDRQDEVDENSLYRVYSMTKPITGMATMMLIDDGKLGLDQPLGEILPAFAEMQVLNDPEGALDDTVPAESPITIRQLLTHTAGLSYIISAKGPLGQAYVEHGLVGGRVSRLPIPGIPEVTPAPDLATWADRLAELPLIAQPGTKWEYSASIDLLGRVIEVASGQSFESFLQERIFTPCGMTSTFFTLPESEIDRTTTNYGIAGGFPLPVDPASTSIYLDPPSVPSGGGGLISSPKDYDRFMRMILGYGNLDGTQVMSEAAVKLGTSDLLPETADTSESWIAGEGHGAGGRVVGSQYGWGGAAGTLASVDFDLNMRVCLFTQYMPTEAYPIRKEFLAALQADMAAMAGG